MRLSVRESDEESLWAIVLAGGEGTRLRSVTRELYGQARPKQYAVLSGTRPLLRQTLDRVARLVPPRRTIVVTLASHAGYLTAELADLPGMTVLAQPCDRGTAAGVLLPEPERDYGWIEPGGRLGWEDGMPFRQVRSFLEKPTETQVRHLYELGCLWNTFVLGSTASALIEAGRQAIPLLHDRLVRLTVFTGTRHEPWAMEQAYLLAPHAEFSRSILEEPSLPLAVGAIDAFSWCDLGTSERVARSLRSLGAPTPSWLTTLAEKGCQPGRSARPGMDG